MASSLLAILKTRGELLTLELEEESTRLFSYLILSLLALFFLCLSILLGVLLFVVIFWETHRIGVITGLTALFGILSLVIGLSVWNCYRKKPRLLDATLTELSKDIDALKPAPEEAASDE